MSIVSLFKNHFWLFEPLKLFPSGLEETISWSINKKKTVFTSDKIFPQEVWQH